MVEYLNIIFCLFYHISCIKLQSCTVNFKGLFVPLAHKHKNPYLTGQQWNWYLLKGQHWLPQFSLHCRYVYVLYMYKICICRYVLVGAVLCEHDLWTAAAADDDEVDKGRICMLELILFPFLIFILALKFSFKCLFFSALKFRQNWSVCAGP